jgi:hypothetical protein
MVQKKERISVFFAIFRNLKLTPDFQLLIGLFNLIQN